MKIRIKGNSIRLRLGQSEVRQLLAERVLEESTGFGPAPIQQLRFVLSVSSTEQSIRADFDDGRVDIRVPSHVITDWAMSDVVGIDAQQPIGDGRVLKINVEKDFECLEAPAGESQADAFPNPRAGSGCVREPEE